MNWIERDAAVVWHGFTQMGSYAANSPVIVERAEGRELIDVDGRRYLDAISSLWVTTLGHRIPELDAAVRAQLDSVAHTTLLGNGNRATIEFAERLARVVPVDSPHVLFASDGACAVEQALKIAFQFWRNRGVGGRDTYLTFSSAYHGDTVGALSLGGAQLGADLFERLRFPVIRAPSFEDPAALQVAARMVREHADRLAAVVVEPLVQGAAGMLIANADDFPLLANACRESDVLLIADEVATGFGRTGTLFACEQCDVRPDLLCLGKGITGGYLPMSATVVSQRVYDAFLGPDLGSETLYHGHSYGGNALAAAVASKHLELMHSWNVLENVRARSRELRAALASQIETLPWVRAIRVCGLMAAVELNVEPGSLQPRRVVASMVDRGVLTRSLGPAVTIVPPLTTTTDEIELIVSTLRAALQECMR
jgi:adenosylmethionine-8-amino-7-oxononanoate aminotransferase